MDLLMGAHQESDCRATSSDSPITPPHLAVALRDQERATETLDWYAVYTSANHEKRVAEQFAVRRIEYFLPQYESLRKWKDRKVKLQMPLFPGYVFVQIELAKRLRVLQVPGVARLVGFNGQPTPLPEADLLRVREFLSQGLRAAPHPMLKVGRRVRVKDGPLAGMEGFVVRSKNRTRFVISFTLIQRAMAVDLEAIDLEPLGENL